MRLDKSNRYSKKNKKPNNNQKKPNKNPQTNKNNNQKTTKKVKMSHSCYQDCSKYFRSQKQSKAVSQPTIKNFNNGHDRYAKMPFARYKYISFTDRMSKRATTQNLNVRKQTCRLDKTLGQDGSLIILRQPRKYFAQAAREDHTLPNKVGTYVPET